ncbi:MAG: dihydrofolate reductase family protein [Rikenellaceae bacterium]|nr:dihydrofolate reductase family protein [Rikenellaceae bacterium]
MKIIVSAAVSIDGYLDDASPERLVLSNREDWDEVMQLRAQCDAILVGASTLRSDNPALVTKSDELRRLRVNNGKAPDPVKVTITGTGDLDPGLRFFTEGDGRKIVIANAEADTVKLARLSPLAAIKRLDTITAQGVADYLHRKGISTLMVEGGSQTLTMFFSEGMVGELRLAVAPFFVGDSSAPRLVGNGIFPFNPQRRMVLAGVRKVGDMAVMHYRLGDER